VGRRRPSKQLAGLGTTGGGVPGDSYPDINAGVLAQIQHLVVYSGERIADPVGARTKLKQDDILESIASRDGHTTFADLSRRWAADRHYGASIEWVANSYRDAYCKKHEPEPAEEAAIAPKTEKRMAAVEPLAPAAALALLYDEAAPAETTLRTMRRVRGHGTVGPARSGRPMPARSLPPRTLRSQPRRVIEKARIAPVPARKPVATAAAEPTLAPVVETAPTAEAAPESSTPKTEPETAAGSDPAAEIETATATTAEQPPAPAEARSFAFAAAMPVPAPSPAPKTVTPPASAAC
jgi:DNA polymerase III gamma/tau subunit